MDGLTWWLPPANTPGVDMQSKINPVPERKYFNRLHLDELFFMTDWFEKNWKLPKSGFRAKDKITN